jgi:hypothetical protein
VLLLGLTPGVLQELIAECPMVINSQGVLQELITGVIVHWEHSGAAHQCNIAGTATIIISECTLVGFSPGAFWELAIILGWYNIY